MWFTCTDCTPARSFQSHVHLSSHRTRGRHSAPFVAAAEPPEAALQCNDCKPGRTILMRRGAAVHRKMMHGVALPADIETELEARPTAAAFAPSLQPVPASALKLPWVRWPSDPEVCGAIVERIGGVANLASSDSERAFWESVRAVASVIAVTLASF